MSDAADPLQTSESLLEKLQRDSVGEATWTEFVSRYEKVLRSWCHAWGVQRADADDITQNVLVKLHQHMRDFRLQAGGRFRSWLKTIARRAWYDYSNKRKHKELGTGDSEIMRLLNSVEARDDFLTHFDRMAEEEILAFAICQARTRVTEQTWNAFRMMSFDGKSGEETATLLGMNPGAVFVANSKMKRLLHDIVQELDTDHE